MVPIFYSELSKETLVKLLVKRKLMKISKALPKKRQELMETLMADDQAHGYKTIVEANPDVEFTPEMFSKKPRKKEIYEQKIMTQEAAAEQGFIANSAEPEILPTEAGERQKETVKEAAKKAQTVSPTNEEKKQILTVRDDNSNTKITVTPRTPQIQTKSYKANKADNSRKFNAHKRENRNSENNKKYAKKATENSELNYENTPEVLLNSEIENNNNVAPEIITVNENQAVNPVNENSEVNEINETEALEPEKREVVGGVLNITQEGYGFLRTENYNLSSNDYFVSPQLIRRFNLREGDYVRAYLRKKRGDERFQAINYIKDVNDLSPEKLFKRPNFSRLVPIYTQERYTLETSSNELSTRIIDLICPIGKGQRGMIVSPPKAGKTILLQKIADAISHNNPEAHLIVLLIDERPEEVTDMQRRINGEVVYSTFDQTAENHVRITELVLERAKRLVELGRDVVILLDSITRLARAYNLTINPTGRTLSGGLDPGALYGPKRFFGAARKIENGGSLTIVATALVETGSRMDEVIFEEFKGTGNMEVFLDRKLSEKRIFPAIDINRSGTRREELLLNERELDCVWAIRKALSRLDTASVTELILNFMQKTKNNAHFIECITMSLNDKDIIESLVKKNTGNKNNSANAF